MSDLNNKKLILILGMHRSGTSALASIIESMGIAIGNKTSLCDIDNPEGYFENKDIVEFNDKLLKFLGGRWDNPFFDYNSAIQYIDDNELNLWKADGKNLLLDNFSKTDSLLIKDPRNSILLPFWQEVFEIVGLKKSNLNYVFIFRHPIEVAISQQKRCTASSNRYLVGNKLNETVALWFNYNFQILKEFQTDKLLLIEHFQLLENSESQINRIASFLNLPNIDLSGVIKNNLYRSKSNSEVTTNPLVLKIYSSLQKLADSEISENHLINEEFEYLLNSKNLCNIFSEMSSILSSSIDDKYDFNRLEDMHEELTVRTRKLGIHCQSLAETIEQLKNSNSTYKAHIEDLEKQRNSHLETIHKKHQNELTLLSVYVKSLFTIWLNQYSDINIYGAGKNTDWFLKILKELNYTPNYIFDDSPAQTSLANIPIVKSDDMDAYNMDAILVSSESYHDQMSEKVKKAIPELPILNPFTDINIHPFSKE